jgi:hypothetical protein
MYRCRDRILKEVATAGKTITYKEIGQLIYLDVKKKGDLRKLSDILGEISEKEAEEGRPMLSAVVVSYDKQIPGKGFFNLAERLGLEELNERDEDFHRRELRSIHDYWKKG